MSKKVLPQEIDLEALLKTAIEDSGHSQEEELIIHDNILEFMSYYNIKPGTFPVKKRVIYKIFKAWSKAENYGPRYFGLKLTQFFESDVHNVFINYDAIDLTKKAKEVFFKLDTSKKTTNKNRKQQIEKFLVGMSVNPGDYIIHSSALYYIYEGWALSNRKKVMGIRTFSSYIKFYLKSYKEYVTSTYFFYIDKNTLKVDGVTLEKAKAWSEIQTCKKNNKEKTDKEQEKNSTKKEDKA